jgi:magnesium-transporting ATPase (P-type)
MSYYKFFTVKIIAIIYYSIFYFIAAFLASIYTNKYQTDFNLEENKKKYKNDKIINFGVFLEILFYFALIGVLFYLIRKIVKRIPFPLNNIAGFDIHRLTEYSGDTVMACIFFIFQTKLTNKLNYVVSLIT